MPFPEGWPPTRGTSATPLRFFIFDTATGSFEDNAYLFADSQTGTSACPKRATDLFPIQFEISNDGTADLLVSFDGTTTHDLIRPGRTRAYPNRAESGVAVSTPAVGLFAFFRIRAW